MDNISTILKPNEIYWEFNTQAVIAQIGYANIN